MIRLVFLCCCLFVTSWLKADQLDDRLQMLLPDEAQSQQTERQYLKKQLLEVISQLKADKVDRKSTKKKIQRITAKISGTYLKQYSLKAELPDFFQKGIYNDATASLVYAIILEAFEVPYYAMVNHWDVFILADPKGKQQRISTIGTAHKGALERGYRFDYVEMLNLTVLPAQRPTTAAGVDSLYHRYHYAAKELLNFKQLAAYWHYQRALRAYYFRDYLLVIRRLSVARQLEERLAFSALEQATYLQLANLEGEDGQQGLFYLFELWNKDPNNAYLPAALLTNFIQSTEKLIKDGDEFLPGEQLYNFLYSRGAARPAWRLQLKELYFLQKSRFAAAIGRYDLASTYVDSLYRMQPDNPVFRKVAANLSLWSIRASGKTGEALQEDINDSLTRFPFLKDYTGINDLLLADQAKAIRGFYEADQGYAGDNLLLQFRSRLPNTKPGPRRSIWVLTAYLSASNYYFRYGDYGQALRLIEEALRYSPDDDYLLHRREVLQRY